MDVPVYAMFRDRVHNPVEELSKFIPYYQDLYGEPGVAAALPPLNERELLGDFRSRFTSIQNSGKERATLYAFMYLYRAIVALRLCAVNDLVIAQEVVLRGQPAFYQLSPQGCTLVKGIADCLDLLSGDPNYTWYWLYIINAALLLWRKRSTTDEFEAFAENLGRTLIREYRRRGGNINEYLLINMYGFDNHGNNVFESILSPDAVQCIPPPFWTWIHAGLIGTGGYNENRGGIVSVEAFRKSYNLMRFLIESCGVPTDDESWEDLRCIKWPAPSRIFYRSPIRDIFRHLGSNCSCVIKFDIFFSLWLQYYAAKIADTSKVTFPIVLEWLSKWCPFGTDLKTMLAPLDVTDVAQQNKVLYGVLTRGYNSRDGDPPDYSVHVKNELRLNVLERAFGGLDHYSICCFLESNECQQVLLQATAQDDFTTVRFIKRLAIQCGVWRKVLLTPSNSGELLCRACSYDLPVFAEFCLQQRSDGTVESVVSADDFLLGSQLPMQEHFGILPRILGCAEEVWLPYIRTIAKIRTKSVS
ncbi:MAG: hypothetical protein LBF84_00580 [Holosporales bacterium]|jgi:hypothetical protein|nr:hypothetical protein [Holosporales bacterium]